MRPSTHCSSSCPPSQSSSAHAVQLGLGLGVALGLYRLSPRGARLLTVLMFVPNIVTPVVGALFLRWMFVSQWGLIDVLMTTIGLPPVNWLGHPLWAKVTVVLADTWRHAPFV